MGGLPIRKLVAMVEVLIAMVVGVWVCIVAGLLICIGVCAALIASNNSVTLIIKDKNTALKDIKKALDCVKRLKRGDC